MTDRSQSTPPATWVGRCRTSTLRLAAAAVWAGAVLCAAAACGSSPEPEARESAAHGQPSSETVEPSAPAADESWRDQDRGSKVASDPGAEEFLASWLRSLRARDLERYASHYADSFRGELSFRGDVTEHDRAGWLAARKKHFKQPVYVGVENVFYREDKGRIMASFDHILAVGLHGHRGVKFVEVGRGEDGEYRIFSEKLEGGEPMSSEQARGRAIDLYAVVESEKKRELRAKFTDVGPQRVALHVQNLVPAPVTPGAPEPKRWKRAFLQLKAPNYGGAEERPFLLARWAHRDRGGQAFRLKGALPMHQDGRHVTVYHHQVWTKRTSRHRVVLVEARPDGTFHDLWLVDGSRIQVDVARENVRLRVAQTDRHFSRRAPVTSERTFMLRFDKGEPVIFNEVDEMAREGMSMPVEAEEAGGKGADRERPRRRP